MTPFGRAGFCALDRPSTKFDPDGKYNARVLLDPGPETDALIATLQAMYDQAYEESLAEVRKDKPKTEDIKRADPPFGPQEDPDTGEKLPGYQINASLSAVVRDKNKAILFRRAPIVVDKNNNPVTVGVGGGSIIRMSFRVSKFYTKIGAGLSLRLIGVQVRDLIPIGVGDPGFSPVDGSFEGKASDPVEHTHAPETAPVVDSPGVDVDVQW